MILETKQLCKFYGAGENQVKAVNQVDIQIEQGEFVAIVGKSGSGKSTLLHMLGGLDTPTKGSVTLAGKDLYRMKEDALAVFRRRKIGFVFQAFRHDDDQEEATIDEKKMEQNQQHDNQN